MGIFFNKYSWPSVSAYVETVLDSSLVDFDILGRSWNQSPADSEGDDCNQITDLM